MHRVLRFTFYRKVKAEQTPAKRPARASRKGSPVSEPEGPSESSPDGDEGAKTGRRRATGGRTAAVKPRRRSRGRSTSASRKQEPGTPTSE